LFYKVKLIYMLPLLASLEAFKFILQIVLWIAIPAILIATGIVYFLHYRKQKKESTMRLKKLEALNADISLSATIQSDEMHALPELSYEGEQLLKKYRKEIKSTSAKYDLLKREFGRIEEKYMELMASRQAERLQIGNGAKEPLDYDRIAQYEATIANLEKALQHKHSHTSEANENWEEIVKEKEEKLFQREQQLYELERELKYYAEESGKLSDQLAALRNEAGDGIEKDAGELEYLLQQRLAETERGYKKEITGLLLQIERSNQEISQLKANRDAYLQKERLMEAAVPVDGNGIVQNDLLQQLKRLEEEKAQLRSRLTEENYLQDLLQEKNDHINFLQLQLEQRIKNYRSLEHQHIVESEAIKVMDELVKKNEQELARLKEMVKEKDTTIIETQGLLEAAHKHTGEQQVQVLAKETELENIRNQEAQMRQNHALLEVTLVNNNKTIGQLNNQLFEQSLQMEELEKKLEVSSQLLIKIYKELARSFGTSILNNMAPEKLPERELNSLFNKTPAEVQQVASLKEPS
jgi:DNA repair exonuclease SbcCD ATPase subunit